GRRAALPHLRARGRRPPGQEPGDHAQHVVLREQVRRHDDVAGLQADRVGVLRPRRAGTATATGSYADRTTVITRTRAQAPSWRRLRRRDPILASDAADLRQEPAGVDETQAGYPP